jgi:hypothetical protein
MSVDLPTCPAQSIRLSAEQDLSHLRAPPGSDARLRRLLASVSARQLLDMIRLACDLEVGTVGAMSLGLDMPAAHHATAILVVQPLTEIVTKATPMTGVGTIT